jgi:hypothetical protein
MLQGKALLGVDCLAVVRQGRDHRYLQWDETASYRRAVSAYARQHHGPPGFRLYSRPARGGRRPNSGASSSRPRSRLLQGISTLAFFTTAFAIPLFFHPLWQVALVYGGVGLVQGLSLSIVFQLAHPVIADVVEQVCRENGVRYSAHASVWRAVASHYSWLRSMGRPA